MTVGNRPLSSRALAPRKRLQFPLLVPGAEAGPPVCSPVPALVPVDSSGVCVTCVTHPAAALSAAVLVALRGTVVHQAAVKWGRRGRVSVRAAQVGWPSCR